jgi:hypothetical protein
VVKAANAFYSLRIGNLDILNSDNVVLIPKKDDAESITYFHPISLIHSFAKIIVKLLALRLVPHMSSIISTAQSAFIKRKGIHDNFMSVRNATRRYHNSKQPTLFLKLDITKALDLVRWEYLLNLLNILGFPVDGKIGLLRSFSPPPRGCCWTASQMHRSSMVEGCGKEILSHL